MLLKSYGLKRNNRTDRNFKCQEVNFSEVKKTQGELNKHLQFDHKITFKCFVCGQIYNTVNGKSKHYKSILNLTTHAQNVVIPVSFQCR